MRKTTPKLYYTAAELAELLGVSRRTATRIIVADASCQRIGNAVILSTSAVKRLKKERAKSS